MVVSVGVWGWLSVKMCHANRKGKVYNVQLEREARSGKEQHVTLQHEALGQACIFCSTAVTQLLVSKANSL